MDKLPDITYEELVFKKRHFSSPIVYIYFKNKVPLYVGFSRAGLTRPFEPNHQKAIARKKSDEIRVLVCKNETDARDLERELIYRYEPEYNLENNAKITTYDCGDDSGWCFVLKTGYYTSGKRLMDGSHEKWYASRMASALAQGA